MDMLRAIQKGADGVYVVGCPDGGCRFQEGNLRARERVSHVRELLEEVGLEGGRVAMVQLASGQAREFSDTARQITEKIIKLGPNPLKRCRKNSESMDL